MDPFIINLDVPIHVQDEKMRHVAIYVDRDSIIDCRITPNLMVPKGLLRDFSKFRVIDEKYWYTTSGGSESYMELNYTKRPYKTYQDSLLVVGQHANDISKKILELFKESSEKNREKDYKIDFISFGTGTAGKELKLLETFLVMYKDERNGNENEPVTFMPVDLSSQLLLRAVDDVYKKFEIAISLDELKIEPHMMNVENAEFDHFGNNKYRLITALGIIHSMEVPNVFKILEKLMQKETLLLIDVSMIEDEKAMIASYEDGASKQFISSPMDLILKTAKHAHEIKNFGGDIYQSIKEYEDLELNLDDIHAKIITKEGLDQFVKEHRLPQISKQKILVNSSAGSKTIVILYEPPGKNPCILGHSTRFTPEGINELLSKTNLESVTKEPWIYADKKIMYYLLRLKRDGSIKNKTDDKSNSSRQQTVRI